jgi:DNA-binding NarL/FixJ family response regulator
VIRVFIVDDSTLTRDGLRTLLARADDVEVIGEAADGASAVGFIMEHKPDVVLMDIALPGIDGMRSTEKILALDDQVRILFLSAHYDLKLLQRAIAAGGHGYVIKMAGPDELLKAVRAVNRGDKYFSPEFEGLLAEELQDK